MSVSTSTDMKLRGGTLHNTTQRLCRLSVCAVYLGLNLAENVRTTSLIACQYHNMYVLITPSFYLYKSTEQIYVNPVSPHLEILEIEVVEKSKILKYWKLGSLGFGDR